MTTPLLAGQKIRATDLDRYSTPVRPTLNSAWDHLVEDSVPWNGLWYWARNGVVTVSGAVKTLSATPGISAVVTLPVGFRPPHPFQSAEGFYVVPDGRVISGPARASGYGSALSMTFAAVPA